MTAPLLLSADTLAAAVTQLCAGEPRFAPVVARHGVPALRSMPGGLESLLQIVTEQFLSLQAAQAIWLRLAAQLSPLTAERLLNCGETELMSLGLSRAKARSFHGIARVLVEDPQFFTSLDKSGDEEARKALLALPGVGPWTAEIYLLAVLQRPDAWPWGDLALRVAAADLLGLPAVPDLREMRRLGDAFSPLRAVAARLLWSHYRGLKGLRQAT